MTFQLARKKLDDLAQGLYHAMRIDLTTYKDGRTEVSTDMYIERVGWTTRDNKTWEEALSEMTTMMTKSDSVSDIEINEMVYGSDQLTAEEILEREA